MRILYPPTQLHRNQDFRRKHRGKWKLYKHLKLLEDKTVIIVAGYEKSGSSWLVRLLAQALDCPAGGYAGDLRPRATEVATEGLTRKGRPDLVVLKSHLRYSDFHAIDPARVKLLTIVRDPRDIVVSGMHFFFGGAPGDDEKALLRMRGSRNTPGWKSYVRDYVVTHAPRVRYEDLLSETEDCVRQLLHGLGLEYCSETLENAVYEQSFDVAKIRYARTGETHKYSHALKGRPGVFRKELSRQMIEKIEMQMSPMMQRLGYERHR